MHNFPFHLQFCNQFTILQSIYNFVEVATFFLWKVYASNVTKMGLAKVWAIFSQTHLVTLFSTHHGELLKIHMSSLVASMVTSLYSHSNLNLTLTMLDLVSSAVSPWGRFNKLNLSVIHG
jgi:hypothetical protein